MARVAVYHGVNATIFRAKRHFLRSRGNVRFVFEKVIMQGVRYCGDWMTTDRATMLRRILTRPFYRTGLSTEPRNSFFV
jgi:hypothetical protein